MHRVLSSQPKIIGVCQDAATECSEGRSNSPVRQQKHERLLDDMESVFSIPTSRERMCLLVME